MLRIACESCKAPYQVDERRIPPQGLKMRCPKCGTTFLVASPSAAPAEPVSAPGAAPAAPATPAAPAKPPAKMTMVGLGEAERSALANAIAAADKKAAAPPPPRPPSDPALPAARPAPPRAPGARPPAQPVPMAAKAPAPARPPPPAPSAPRIPPAAPSAPEMPTDDFPAARAVPPRAGAPRPQPKPAIAPAAPPAAAPPAAPEYDLPAARPAAARPGSPAAAAPKPPPPEYDLPAARAASPPAAKVPPPELDLPAARPAAAAKAPPPPELDLPAARPAAPRAGAPKPAPAAPDSAPLPAVVASPHKPGSAAPAEADWDLPATADAGLPAKRPSNFPPALGSLDELDLPAMTEAPLPAKKAEVAFGELDLGDDLPAIGSALPALAANLPATAGNLPAPAALLPSRTKAKAAQGDFELDLSPPPAPAKVSRGDFELDLSSSAEMPGAAQHAPAPGGAELAFGELDLPSVASALPALGGSLPAVAESLPAAQSALPAVSNVLPAAASALPAVSNVLPATANVLPSPRGAVDELDLGLSGFGELDLGGDSPSVPPQHEAPTSEAGFGELDLLSVPPGAGSAPPPPPVPPPHDRLPSTEKPLAYGELDLGGPSEGALTMDAPAPPPAVSEASLPQEAAPRSAPAPVEVALPTAPAKKRLDRSSRAPSKAPKIFLALLVLAIAGGGSLQLTKYGAFGYLSITDKLRAQDYAQAATSGAASARTRMGKDTYVDARDAVDELAAAQKRMPRARTLAAYAALATYAYEIRFGADPDRDSHAKEWIAELKDEADVRYLNVALAGQDAALGNWDKAAKSLDAAARRDAGDPIQQDIALLRGIVALKLNDGPGAKTAFETALKLAPSARAHFGLALALAANGDAEGASKEVDLTLAATPNHPSALLMRANLRWQKRDEKGALEDVATVVEGPAKALASPHEDAEALALRGAIHTARGRGGEARTAYEAALKVEPRNVDALLGLGQVYFDDGRYTEALTRLDTALQAEPDNQGVIVLDVLTKAKLERLKEAKDQIVAARAKFPKSMRLAYAAAVVETSLGNKADAEKALADAIDLVRPEDGAKALEPYLALAMLLVADGRAKDADTKLDEMRTKLPESVEMERAVGGYDAAQGHFDAAITHYRKAIELDPQDLSTRFQLAVTLRRMRRMDESATEFDKVLAADQDYPGLALERGLLYEESGEVEKALEQFKNALAKAPDDPDLMLRVGAAYVAIGRPDDTLPILRKVLEKRPQSAEANHYLGRALLAKGGPNMAEAMRNLKHAVELDPNRAEYHLYVAWAANESNPVQLGLAKEEVEKALARDKLLADAYWQRGVTERKEGAVEDALKDLRHALELKPSRIEAHAVMAECYEDKNDEGSAISEWQKAIAANERQPYWRYRYGKLLQQKHLSAEAAKHLKYAVDEGAKLDGGPPPWLANAQFYAAEALRASGRKQEAIELYEKFLAVAPMSSPDRRDAINALSDLGKPWDGSHQ